MTTHKNTLSPEVRADLLKFAMQEDRTEIRFLKERIYNLTSFIAVSSFAVTAFVVGKDGAWSRAALWDSWPLFAAIDSAFVLLLWAVFLMLKKDLDGAHRCLEMRQKMIPHLADPGDDFNVFRPCGTKASDITESSLYWVVSLATLAMLGKGVATILFASFTRTGA
jgi:hypothetical protein